VLGLLGKYARVRFCTSPSGATRITSTRRSDNRRNSMWRNRFDLRGAVTTPTKLDRLDSICAACVITRCGWSGCRASCWAKRSGSSSLPGGREVSMVSTKRR